MIPPTTTTTINVLQYTVISGRIYESCHATLFNYWQKLLSYYQENKYNQDLNYVSSGVCFICKNFLLYR